MIEATFFRISIVMLHTIYVKQLNDGNPILHTYNFFEKENRQEERRKK